MTVTAQEVLSRIRDMGFNKMLRIKSVVGKHNTITVDIGSHPDKQYVHTFVRAQQTV